MTTQEVNFDGLVGPTHNYAGLSPGNIASTMHAGTIGRPRDAALQGLQKMKRLMDAGLTQGVIPPLERPDVHMLRAFGFGIGRSDEHAVQQAYDESPTMLAACSSASSMWAANAATVTPSADAEDNRVHFTPANLASHLHRSIEARQTGPLLKAIFKGDTFQLHDPLPPVSVLGDEGAANHSRLCKTHADPAVEVFVFGARRVRDSAPDGLVQRTPRSFPARQTYEASRAVARHHRLHENRALFFQQDPDVIDRGVFHNDVIAVANEQTILCHEAWLLGRAEAEDAIRHACAALPTPFEPRFIIIEEADLSVEEAVATYLFNSQLLTLPSGKVVLHCPAEVQQHPRAAAAAQRLVEDADIPIHDVWYSDVRESMRNGGGPACLRLRVVLTQQERDQVAKGCLLNEDIHAKLIDWVNRHYREEVGLDDLKDPALLKESRDALDELTRLLDLGSVYPFQQ